MRRVVVAALTGNITIRGVAGLDRVTARDGEGVVIAQDGDLVRVSASGQLDNPTEIGWLDTVFKAIGRVIPVDVRLEVPESLDLLEISAKAGNVEVVGVRTRLELDSVAGNVTVQGAIGFRIGSTAGNVEVRARLTEGESSLRVQAGNATVRLEPGSDLSLSASVTAGELHTRGFTLTKTDKGFAGGSLEGRLGSGRGRLEVRLTAGEARIEAEGSSEGRTENGGETK